MSLTRKTYSIKIKTIKIKDFHASISSDKSLKIIISNNFQINALFQEFLKVTFFRVITIKKCSRRKHGFFKFSNYTKFTHKDTISLDKGLKSNYLDKYFPVYF